MLQKTKSKPYETAMKTTKILMIAGLLALAANLSAEDNQPMIGKLAPDFALQTTSGDTVSSQALRGKFVVIHFAASW